MRTIKCEQLKDLELTRAYANLFLPNDRPYFHQDGNVVTCLFYVTPEYDLDEGGETQFVVNNLIQGLLPRPVRLVVFDGELWHRATSYRANPRITIAIKFTKKLRPRLGLIDVARRLRGPGGGVK